MIKGSGLTLATMNAQAKVNLRKSTIGEVNLEQGTLTATVANQRIRVSDGSLKAADTMLTIRGDIGTDLKQQGQLDYQLRVGNLSPWLALIDQRVRGRSVLVGQAKGNFSDLKAQGKITASSLIYRETAVQRGSIDYDFGYSSVRPLPFGTVNSICLTLAMGINCKLARSGENPIGGRQFDRAGREGARCSKPHPHGDG